MAASDNLAGKLRQNRTKLAAESTESDPLPLERERQPRRDRTREALVRAGQKLFSERPVDIVSVDEIVQVAEVAKGTFYNHFNDKDEFERAILAEARRELECAIQAAIGGDPDPAIRMAVAICVAVRFSHDHPNRARLIVRQTISGTNLQSELNAAMMQDVSAGILSGRFTVPTVEIGALAQLGLGDIGIVRALELTEILSKVTLGQQLATMLLRALGLPGEEAYMIAARAAEKIIRAPSGAASLGDLGQTSDDGGGDAVAPPDRPARRPIASK